MMAETLRKSFTMSLAPMEDDLEAGLGVESVSPETRSTNFVSGGDSFSGKYMGIFHQETVDEARLLLQKSLEDQDGHENLINLRVKPIKDKHKKVNAKRPPKPPRPPNGPSLDAADLRLIRELSELALEKRMRIERVRDLKKLRASKAAVSSNSSTSTSGSVISLQSSPGPVLSANGGDLISIQVFKDLSPSADCIGRSSETEHSSTRVIKEGSTRDVR